jgi:hypothetical protein
MSHHRYPICPNTGKVRYRERKDIKLALRQASSDRSRARVNGVVCNRREIRSYDCAHCGGWHLTSQPAQSAPLLPVAAFTTRTPGPAAAAIRHMIDATGLMAGAAA